MCRAASAKEMMTLVALLSLIFLISYLLSCSMLIEGLSKQCVRLSICLPEYLFYQFKDESCAKRVMKIQALLVSRAA